MQFATERGYDMEPDAYFYDEFRYKQWLAIRDTDEFQLDHSLDKDSKFGTVGAVACDRNGNVAAATSTGGMTNKKFGRVGDSPLIGVGNYANNKTCAVSCTVAPGSTVSRSVLMTVLTSCIMVLGSGWYRAARRKRRLRWPEK